MTRVLAYTSPALGHLEPVLPILTALRAEGADVAVRTLPAAVESVRRRGLRAEAVDPAVIAVPMQDWTARGQRAALAASVATFTARAPHDAADLDRAIRAEQPDVLLVDVNSWGALAAAEASGLPYAVFAPYPLALRSPDAPPFGPGLPPPRGPLGRAFHRALTPVVLGVLEHAMLPPLTAVRADRGLPPLRRYDDLLHAAPLVLALTAEPFEYPRRDWPANVALVGPCLQPANPLPGTGSRHGTDDAAPDWLEGIDAPIVLVTTSSEYQHDERLVHAAIDGLRGSGLHVVATVPSADPTAFRAGPDAHVVGWAPHGPLLRRAVCAVTHAGMGATQRALAHGVPVCAVPFGRDQHEVARRVEASGAGTRLPSSRLTPARLRAAVRTAIDRRDGAARIARAFAAAPGATGAAHAVLALTTPHPSHDHPLGGAVR